jgi:hypothetical protein
MFATIRQYRTAQGSMDELMHRVDESFADQLSQEPGFCGYEVMDCGDGMLVTMTMFEDREGCERSAELAAAFVRDQLSDVEIERIGTVTGEVMVSRAREAMLQATHH